MMPLSDLKAAPYNPRRIEPAAMAGLAKSMERFGDVGVVVFNMRSGYVVGGHQRLKVLRAKREKETSVLVVDLDESDERALNVALNSPHIAGGFSPALQELLEAIRLDDALLFESLRFGELLDSAGPKPLGDPNAAPPLPKKAKTVPGDLYVLGRHRLLCGDCTDPAVVASACGAARVELMLTDPPWGVDYVEKNLYLVKRGVTKGQIHREIENDAGRDYREWFARFLRPVPWADYATFYVFMAGLHLHDLRLAIDDVGLRWGDYLIWVKHSPVLTRKDYNQRTELVAMGFPPDEERASFTVYGWPQRHRFYGGFKRNNVLEYPKPAASKLHPTMKPVEMLEQLIIDGSPDGGLIYEPFCGSGSTLIAAEQTGRACVAIELDPLYVDVAVARWQEFTGKKVRRGTS